MAESSHSRGPARETRLLLLTLLVSVAVLFLLARFRFPERPITDLSPPQPLARLGHSSLAFDELSTTLTELLRRFEASVVALHAGAGATEAAASPRIVAALRVRDDLALLPVGEGSGGDAVSDATVVARDELRALTLVRVPSRPTPMLSLPPQNEPLDVPGFVAVLEASPNGAAIRAAFVSTLTRVERPGWDAPALLLGGVSNAQPGALLFTLSGRFAGMVLENASGAAIVSTGDALMARLDSLARGESVRLAQPGFTVQPLSDALRKASGAGAAAGVMINGLASGPPVTAAARSKPSAEAAIPEIGDVITAVAGQPVRSLNDWLHLLARHATASTLPLDVMRFGKPMKIEVALASPAVTANAAAGTGASAGAAARIGATFRAAPGGTLDIVSIDPTSPAAHAGLHPGDRITAILPARGAGALTSARIAVDFAALNPGDALVLAIDRQGASRVIAVEKPKEKP